MKKIRNPPISTTNLARAQGASRKTRVFNGTASKQGTVRRSAPDGEQNEVADEQADQPEREQVDVPVPGVAASGLETAQERVVHNSGSRVLQQRTHVQQVLPVGMLTAPQYTSGCSFRAALALNFSPDREQ